MARDKVIKQGNLKARGLDARWPRWMQMARTVPAMRLDKVEGTKKELDHLALDDDRVLDITIDRLAEDLDLGENRNGTEPVG